MVNLVMAHMAYLKTGRTNTNLSVLEQFPYPKLLFWAYTVAVACLGKCVALLCLLLFCLDNGFLYPNEKYYMILFDLEQSGLLGCM